MIGLSKFPRNFNPWTPKAKPPFSLFFVRVNRFLEDPKRLDFSKKENVKHFNDGLTKAIHKDIDDAKIKFLGFRDKLELVETAFESLDKAYYFLDDFDKFAEDCLSKSFQWTEFEDYVKDLTKTITYFQKMKTTKSLIPENEYKPYRNIMSHLRACKFNKWIPSDPPYSSFFTEVQEFFNQPGRWNFSKKESVRLFNEGLTKSIHKDMEKAKANFCHFRFKLQPVENAFESLDKAYLFMDDFDKFADHCLSKSFQWTEFRAYVEDITKRVTYYQNMKTSSYSVTERPLKWPGLDDEPIAVPIDEIDTSRKIGIYTGPNARPTRMAKGALENVQLAISIYNKLNQKYLVPQYQKLMDWLNGSVCWENFRKEFQAEHEHLTNKILNQRAELLTEKEHLEVFLRTGKFTDEDTDLRKTAEGSIQAAQEALQTYYKAVAVYHQIMIDTVLKTYHHALDVQKSFTPLVSTEIWSGSTELAEKERDEAAKSVDNWKDGLDQSEIRKLLQSRTLTTVLKNLPDLYNCIAKFSFKFHSPY